MTAYRQSLLLVVSALMRRGDEILLVEQQWPSAPTSAWTLPGGMVEPGELLPDAVAREVREETGLTVLDPGQLLYSAQFYNPHTGDQSLTFVFEVTEWRGAVQVADPDGLILQARFLPPEQAIEKLQDLSWRVIREPIVAHLRGEQPPGTVWIYRQRQKGETELVAPPGAGPS